MIIDINAMLFDRIAADAITAHLDKKIKFDVIEASKVGSKFKKAVKDEYSASHLNDADYVIRFAEAITGETPADADKGEVDNDEDGEEAKNADPENAGGDEGDAGAEENAGPSDDEAADGTGTGEDGEEEAAGDDGEDEEKNKKKKDGDDETLSESVKVQDLTSQMLQTPKVKKCGCGKKVAGCAKKAGTKCCKESDKEDGGDDKAKKAPEKKAAKKTEAPKDDAKPVEEAETQATGDDLKVRVQKSLGRTFNVDKDKVELFDLPGYLDGYNVFFAKLSFKNKEAEKAGADDSEGGDKEED